MGGTSLSLRRAWKPAKPRPSQAQGRANLGNTSDGGASPTIADHEVHGARTVLVDTTLRQIALRTGLRDLRPSTTRPPMRCSWMISSRTGGSQRQYQCALGIDHGDRPAGADPQTVGLRAVDAADHGYMCPPVRPSSCKRDFRYSQAASDCSRVEHLGLVYRSKNVPGCPACLGSRPLAVAAPAGQGAKSGCR